MEEPEDIYDRPDLDALDPLLQALPNKQKAFVAAYCGEARFNATRAAAMAGYQHPKQTGYRLRNDANIRKAIDARLAAETLSSQEILARWTEIANGDLADFYVVNPGQPPDTPHPAEMDAQLPQVDGDSAVALLGDVDEPPPAEGTKNRVYGSKGLPAYLQEDLVGAAKMGYLHLIKQIRETKYGRQIILYDKAAALDRLARVQGMLTDLPTRREETLINAILDALPDELRDTVEQHIAQALSAKDP